MKTYNRMIAIVVGTFAVLQAPCAVGALRWQSTMVKVEAAPEQSAVDVSFQYVNDGERPTRMLDVKASCHCVVPDYYEGEIAPGAAGELKVRFSVGSKVGSVIETISVSEQGASAPTVLRLLVNIPVLFQLHPDLLVWKVGELSQSKGAIFEDVSGAGCRPVACYSTSTNFETKIVEDPSNRRWIIHVLPRQTEKIAGGHIYLDVDVGNHRIRKIRIIAAVTDPNLKGKDGRPLPLRVDGL